MNPSIALPAGIAFAQPLTPVAHSLALSFLVAVLPIAVALAMLGLFRRPAWQASLAGLATGIVVAVAVWGMPVGLALDAVGAGMALALIPVMWIVFNALLLYNIAVKSGRFDQFRQWMLDHLPDDRRLVLLVVAFSFGCLLEGISGFGTPVAITSALLIALGFPAIEALTFALIFNTAPVAFGALGVPITVLGAVTSLHPDTLGAMVGRQLPFFALLLPFYVVGIYGGLRSIGRLWPALFVSGGSFALAQFVTSNFISYQLTDVLSSLTSLIVTIGFLKIWKPRPDPQFAIPRGDAAVGAGAAHGRVGYGGWLPWLVVSVIVIFWVHAGVAAIGDMKIKWPGLHDAVYMTLYHKPYVAIWDFQPLGTGTAILLSAIVTAVWTRTGVASFFGCVAQTWRQTRIAIVTVMMIVGLAYLLNYSGMSYTLGMGVASTGALFPLVSATLGWIAVFLSGSDTSGNALFGNLQVVAAKQLGFDPVLMAATNSSGGVMGKMISPQNIATGVSTTDLKGQEGVVFARTFWHSVILTLLLGVLVFLQQHVLSWMIPALPH
ncbi:MULTISPECIES: L-lactate permease [Burkholderia]|uniref:L-lactate permease n=1 Tax=Burkholderia savannae TaxID=1637837 RepID=A0ABR5T6L5_9BURK|nr:MULTISPECIES: L-lactate permease [Burkholderia]AOJ72207.1 lactate permease [Burkholderia savannae]AOJ83101.1 lactate permease [Burkholderia savannae]AOK50654.1 lactate permease [Burkholderia sp. MSMB617WGS]KGR93160.1 transporter, lactate permease family protein [Burkholderia sp. ABCPW 111]KVG48218.1 lactate permease [Burkholderia sp. MSMB0265]